MDCILVYFGTLALVSLLEEPTQQGYSGPSQRHSPGQMSCGCLDLSDLDGQGDQVGGHDH